MGGVDPSGPEAPLELVAGGELELGSSGGPNPLAVIPDDELWNATLYLMLACGRNHAALRHERRQYFCGLGKALKVEATLRGVPFPTAPYHTGDARNIA